VQGHVSLWVCARFDLTDFGCAEPDYRHALFTSARTLIADPVFAGNHTMKVLSTALAFGLAISSVASAEDSKIFNLPYASRTLDNGLKVYVVPADTPGTVSIQIPMQTGSRNEVEKGKSGFAHFFEHMMFRGTPKYPADAYGAIIKNAGADQNAYTSNDLTNYYTNFTSADLEKIIEVEADRFQNLSYTEEQFRTEALAVKGEYLKNYSNPIAKGFEKLSELAYSVHPYGHTTMGYLADIEDMPNQMDYAKVFFDRWYRPEYASVIIVGDVDAEKTLGLVEKYFGSWQRGSYQVEIPTEPPMAGPKYAHITWEGPTLPWLLHSWRGPAFNASTATTPALMLLSELYFGPTSELYQQVVVRERMVDQFFAQPPMDIDPGLFGVGARLTDPKFAGAVNAAIAATLIRARSELLPAERVAQTQSRVKYSFAATLDSAASIGSTLATFVHFERDPETLNRLYASFDRVTPQDIQDAANLVFLDSNRASISIATDATLKDANTLASLDAGVAAAANPGAASTIKTVELPSQAPLIDVRIQFATGAAQDPVGKKGLAQLTASMLTQGGTAKRSFEELQRAQYPLAADLQAQVDKDMITFIGTVHRDNIDAWYSLVREMLLEPGFREDDLTRLKQQQVNAIRVNLRGNNDEELGKEALYELIYGPAHAYGSLNAGHAGDVEKLTLADVRQFYATQLTGANVVVGLGGAYDAAFRQRLLRDLGALGGSSPSLTPVPEAPAQSTRRARILEKENTAVAVSFGWPIDVSRGDVDWPALWLARSYLGEHRNSGAQLYNRIRELRGMNYGNYAYIEYFPYGMYLMQPNPNYARQTEIFQIWLRPLRSNNDALFATRAALFELEKLSREGISQESFDASRAFLNKFVAILTASSGTRLGYALDAHYFGTPAFVDYVRTELDKLTPERVNAAIRKHFKLDQAQFVFVAKDAKGLADALAADTPSPIIYNSEKPAELTDEDKLIAVQPFKLARDRIEVIKADSVFE